jgi:hypothetical protein
MLIEKVKINVWYLKAYAKYFGSYEKIESGLSGEAMSDLTGAPCEYLMDLT